MHRQGDKEVIILNEETKPKQRPDSLNYQFVHGFKRGRYPGDGIYHAKNQVLPWCVTFGYASHYFAKMVQALRYAAYRKFITTDMVDIIRIRLEEEGFTDE